MNQERLMRIVLAPVISEKSTTAAVFNQYTFKVDRSADKSEIKQAVELLFDVNVAAVHVCNVKGKNKRFGQRFGRRSDWKKAYVTLLPGQTIEMMAGAE